MRASTFLTIGDLLYNHRSVFTTLGEMIDADEAVNPQHFGSDPSDIRIRIRINPGIWIRIPDDALAEVYAL